MPAPWILKTFCKGVSPYYQCSFCPMTGCCSDFLRPNAKPLKKLFKTTTRPTDPTHLTTALMAADGPEFFGPATPNWNVSVVSLACTWPHVRITYTHCVFYSGESRPVVTFLTACVLRCCYLKVFWVLLLMSLVADPACKKCSVVLKIYRRFCIFRMVWLFLIGGICREIQDLCLSIIGGETALEEAVIG